MAWILVLLLAAVQVPASRAVSATTGDEAIAGSFFPAEIQQESAKNGLASGESAWASVEIAGMRRIVAVYTNGFTARVRLIDPAEPPRLLDEHEAYSMHGIFPHVQIAQISPDPAPEAIVRMASAKGAQLDWIFSIAGDRLRVVGPMRANSTGMTAVVDASYRDIDGDGVLEIFSETGRFGGNGQPEEVGPQRYRLDKDGNIQAVGVAYYGVFYRNTGAPTAETDRFETSRTSGTLAVYNSLAECTSVPSALIRLNGKTVLSPRDFPKSQVRRVPVELKESNELVVEMAGGPQGAFMVVIETEQ